MALTNLNLGRTVRFSVGKAFFDRNAVLAAIGKKKAARLSRAGALVWRTMRRSIRQARRKKISELTDEEREIYDRAVRRAEREGRPRPKVWWHVHSKPGEPPRSITGLLKKHIYFAYDSRTESVVIGPAKLSGTSGTAPEVLEFGGLVRPKRLGKGVTIEPRPYARPALEKTQGRFAEVFKDLWQ